MTVMDEWGMKCPECGSDEDLKVEVRVMAWLSAEGTDPEGDQEWDSESPCECRCGWHGTVKQAKEAGQNGG
jgi:hypothetical protein